MGMRSPRTRRSSMSVPDERFTKGLTVQDIPFLFTVESICKLVEQKLGDKAT